MLRVRARALLCSGGTAEGSWASCCIMSMVLAWCWQGDCPGTRSEHVGALVGGGKVGHWGSGCSRLGAVQGGPPHALLATGQHRWWRRGGLARVLEACQWWRLSIAETAAAVERRGCGNSVSRSGTAACARHCACTEGAEELDW